MQQKPPLTPKQKQNQTKRKQNQNQNQDPLSYMKWILTEWELPQAVVALLIQTTYKYSNL